VISSSPPCGIPALALTLTLRVVEFVNVTLLTTNPPEIVTVAPLTNPVPVTLNDTVLPFATICGEADVGDVIVGAETTVKQLEQDATPASPFVTVTLRAPVVALDAIVMFAVTCVAETKVVEFTVMPVPEKAAARVPPLTNPVPFTVTF
jgi:hypothetical protein